VYDYVDGKADWMAYGLPVEGDDGPFLGQQLVEVPTCAVSSTVADARRLLRSSGTGASAVVVVTGDGLAVGEVDLETLADRPDDAALLDVMDPVPTTVRPSVTVASLAEGGGGERLVTTSDGRLLGRATVEASIHHDDHDHQDTREERYEAEMTAVLQAVEERFGDREPTADELHAFLRERLVSEGRSVEDAERFLDQLDDAEAE
jgi:CBS domain-containing protein